MSNELINLLNTSLFTTVNGKVSVDWALLVALVFAISITVGLICILLDIGIRLCVQFGLLCVKLILSLIHLLGLLYQYNRKGVLPILLHYCETGCAWAEGIIYYRDNENRKSVKKKDDGKTITSYKPKTFNLSTSSDICYSPNLASYTTRNNKTYYVSGNYCDMVIVVTSKKDFKIKSIKMH